MSSDERVLIPIDPSDELPEVVIRHGDAARIYTYKGFQYGLGSVQALIDLIKVRGSKDNTIIIYTEKSIRAILDDMIDDREQDTATYSFKFSDQFKEWLAILDDQLSQKELVQFLKHRPDAELSAEYRDLLLGAAQSLKLVTETVGEFEYKDNNNIGITFKTKDGEGQTYIPSNFEISLPIFNEGKTFDIEIEIELKKPTTDNPRLAFTLTCPTRDRYVKDAAEDEVRVLKSALAGYIVLAGS